MPARRIAKPSASRSAQPAKRRVDPDNIITRRSELIETVAQLRGDDPSPLTDKAQQLLTRWWSSAAWDAREQLLHTVQWLIQLERSRRGGIQPSA